ncbi:MAG TPA: outer membrane beta-barrel protein [Polyangiaceae bacterium]|nr:outer membrane beta-barrel protein [Polyangiaceae bacterium]
MPKLRTRRTLPVALGAAGIVLAPGPAFAGAGEWHVGGRLGAATVRHGSLGPALDLHAGYELSDYFDVVMQATASRHDGSAGPTALTASAGIAYKIDVFEWIPYVSALGGYYRYEGPKGASNQSAGWSLHGGVDYLVSRSFSLGGDVGFHAILGESPPVSLQTTFLVGAEYRFGW